MSASSVWFGNSPWLRGLVASALALAGTTALGAGPDTKNGAVLYANCTSCHGAQGEGNPKLGAPNLTGQRADYLKRQIEAFMQGTRGAAAGDSFGAQMRSITQVFQGEEDIDDVAAYVAALPIARSAAPASTVKLDLATGKSYFNGICSACHGSDGAGNLSLSSPRLAGQDPAYLVRQYAGFKSGTRGSDASDKYGQQMRSMMRALPDAATEAAVLAYAAALGNAK